ncbi:ThiF family adenylyltransferase [Vibrio coralliilyticus]|uniref:ThiF family adenylyltransferase n=1 Tax=Vibrio coralliilyticus TaxID=190893 RepID=UPI00155FDAD2|nr:ThiF family adenylyltransferase [Vibrio coralliilyticus]NRF32269.1 ThiF family adenylyltransferase [Vibrio coralliilyticus]NRF54318.1 ThiF family adenylyltransferase [Vibrio coralliilyticus]NRG02143.1 ThiF family adenylyltransferase [Vibrio coralliilyticus]
MDYSRNWLFVSPTEQQQLASTKLLIVGCGIGGVVAELALRTGIRHITIADGDTIESSNLNRQNFTSHELGKNKASAVRDRLTKIDATASINVIDKFLDESDLMAHIPDHDFVINTIDFDAPEFPLVHQICKQHKKVEIFPINLGFGSGMTLLEHTTPGWLEYYQVAHHTEIKQAILVHLLHSGAMFDYLVKSAEAYYAKQVEYDSQLAISSSISASMAIGAIVAITKGSPVAKFPQFQYVDVMAPTVL